MYGVENNGYFYLYGKGSSKEEAAVNFLDNLIKTYPFHTNPYNILLRMPIKYTEEIEHEGTKHCSYHIRWMEKDYYNRESETTDDCGNII